MNLRVFRLAVLLQQLPEYASADPLTLELEAGLFIERSNHHAIRDYNAEDIVAMLADCWGRVRAPGQPDQLDRAYQRALEKPEPAYASRFTRQAPKKLLRLMAQLQADAGESDFWLDAAAAGNTVGQHKNTVSYWVKEMMKADDNGFAVLTRTYTGHTGKASSYRLNVK